MRSPFRATCRLHGDAAVAPGRAQFVGRHGDRREAGRGLGLQEAEAARHFVGADRAQAPVIDLNDEADADSPPACSDVRHRNLVDDHAELALEVDPVRLAGKRDVDAAAREVVARALVTSPESESEVRDRRRVEGDVHQPAVIEEGRAVHHCGARGDVRSSSTDECEAPGHRLHRASLERSLEMAHSTWAIPSRSAHEQVRAIDEAWSAACLGRVKRRPVGRRDRAVVIGRKAHGVPLASALRKAVPMAGSNGRRQA